MKIRLLPLLAGVLLVMASATGSVVEVGHWNFDEGASNIISDSSPAGNHGTISNSSMWTTPGHDGTGFSLSFGGYSNPVEATVPHDTSLDFNGYIALSAWVKPVDTGQSILPVIVKGGGTSSNSVPYALYLYDNQVTFLGNYQTGGTGFLVKSGATVEYNEWSHIKAVYDMENVSLYIEDEETSVWQLVHQEAVNYAIINNSSPLAFGIDSPGFTERYGGLIDEVVIEVLEPQPECELIAEEIASMEDSHGGGGVVSYEEKLYVWAGYTNYGPAHYNRTPKMEIYDPDTDTWSSGADIPQLKSQPACFELNGKFYTVGGETNPSGSFTSTVHRYDPDTDTWVQMNNFPRRIWQGKAVVCSGKAYVFGGATGYGNPLSSVYEYDEASDAWIPKAPMLTGVSYPAAVCFDNKIWVFGGVASFHPTVVTEAIQVYDCDTDTWLYCDDMLWKVSHSQAVVYNDDIWLFANTVWDEDAGDWIQNEYAYKFSPGCVGSGEWTRCAFTSTPSIKPGYGSKIGLIDGYAYFTNTEDRTTGIGSERAFKVHLAMSQISALIDIDPDTLNRKSHGKWLTVYITLPDGFDVGTIDTSTIAITSLIGESCDPEYTQGADLSFTPEVGDRDEDGILDLTVKFDRQVLLANLCLDDVSITIEGELTTGELFSGTDGIRIIERGK